MSGTLYDILGLPKDASQADIKSAYRRLAKIYHPDTAANEASYHQKFLEVKNAYEILSNPLRRINYDESLDRPYGTYHEREAYRRPPPPYYYQSRRAPKYSKRTYLYGVLFVVGIAIFAFSFPTYLMIKSANTHFSRGIAYYEAGMYSLALDNFTKSINDMSGKSGLANYYQAYILFYHYHNYQITNKYIDLALEDIDDDSLRSELFWMKGKCFHLAGKNNEALSFLAEVKDFGTAYDSSLFYTGIIYTVIQHNFQEGLNSFEKVLERNKYQTESTYFKAYCLQKLDHHIQAIGIYNELLDRNYEPGAVYFHRALSELKINRRDSACVDLDSAIQYKVVDAEKLKSIYCP